MNHEIERLEAEIAENRARLMATVGALEGRLESVSLAREAIGLMRTRTGAAGAAPRRGRKAAGLADLPSEPSHGTTIALTLAGLALTWLVFARRRAPGADEAADTGAERAADWTEMADLLREEAAERLRRAEAGFKAGVRQGARGAGEALGRGARAASKAASRAAAAAAASEQADVVADLARDLGATFMHGLSDLPEATRIRIAEARQRAYRAALRARAAARSGGREAGRLIEDHPLIAAALAFAVAAALAAILPRAAARGHAPRAEDPADEDPDADDLAPEDFEPDDDTGAAGDAEALMAEAEELERRARRDERRQAAARPQPADREDDLPPAETA